MNTAKLLALIGGGFALNELTRETGGRSANLQTGDSINSDVADLVIQRIKTDAHLQGLLRGPAGSGGSGVAANLEVLGKWLKMDPSGEEPAGDHYFVFLIGETAGGKTDGTDIFVKVDISEFYLKDDESLQMPGANAWDSQILSSNRNPDGTANTGEDNILIPQDQFDWSFEGREGDVLTYKLGGIRQKNGFSPFMRSAFMFRAFANSIQVFPTEEYSIGIEISGGGLAEPITESIIVPPAFYSPL